MKVTKAIITAAGRGTRFLPAVKAYQKEMLPIMDTPQLQILLEELDESGINEVAIVGREGVQTFENYWKDDDKLWSFLQENNKTQYMDTWQNLKRKMHIDLFVQKESDPYGNGVPLIITKDWTNKEPVVTVFGDDIMIHTDKSKPSCIQQMLSYFEKYNPSAVMSVMEVSEKEISKYGSYEYFDSSESEIPFRAKRLIEKPSIEEAPSLYANAARFVLTNDLFEELSKNIRGKDNEIWLADAVNRMMQNGMIVIAAPWEGSAWMPCGDPIHWLEANIVYALNSEKYKSDLTEFLKNLPNN